MFSEGTAQGRPSLCSSGGCFHSLLLNDALMCVSVVAAALCTCGSGFASSVLSNL